MRRLSTAIKHLLFTPGEAPRRVRGGVLRGLVFHLDSADRSQVVLGLSEREIQGWFAKFSRRLATAVDVGGAEGFYTLFFLKKTPARRVIVFEPEASQRAELERNLRLNEIRDDARLEVHPQFVGERDDAEWRTLDSFLPKIESPCLVKVDVEGGEVSVLRGAAGLLARPGVSWIIETHALGLEEECVRILQAAGYRTRIVGKAWWRSLLPETRSLEHNRWLIADRP